MFPKLLDEKSPMLRTSINWIRNLPRLHYATFINLARGSTICLNVSFDGVYVGISDNKSGILAIFLQPDMW